MTKFYCDRCGKECNKLQTIKVPTGKTGLDSFETKPVEVCCDCKKEYDAIINKLTDIRFVLFGDFMKEGGAYDRT